MRKYKIYIDENFPRNIADALNILQQGQNKRDELEIEVLHIKTVFGEGAKDEDWIPKVGKENGIVITQDFRIQTQKHQKQLYIEHKVGILFLKPPSNVGFAYWEMVKQLVNKWDDVKQIVKKNKTPFAFAASAKTKFEKLD